MTHVYGLYEAFSNQPFYIGITDTPVKRLWCHKAALAGKRKDSLTGCAVSPDDVSMRLLALCDDRANAGVIERALWKHYKLKIVTQERLVTDGQG